MTDAVDAVTSKIGSLMGSSDDKEAETSSSTATTTSAPKDAGAATSSTVATAATASSAEAGSSKSGGETATAGPVAGVEEDEGNLIKSTYEVAVTLADQQADPNSPLYSVKSFDQLGISQELLKGIYSMKYQKPSKIQERALPLLLQNPYVPPRR